MTTDPIVIAGAARTPLGAFQGELGTFTAPALGGVAIAAALARAGLGTDSPDEVLMGCVLPAGVGQAPARQAAFAAGVPEDVGCTTINKVCGSAMKAVMLAHDMVVAGTANVVVAGCMESMSNAPYLLDKARGGYRMGHGRVLDHMFLDGLEDAYDPGRLMGTFADDTAEAYQFGRADQDAFALRSLERARAAAADGTFAREVEPVSVSDRKGIKRTVKDDEQPRRADPERIPSLESGVPRGRHGDGGEFELDLGRGGGRGRDAPFGGRAARRHPPSRPSSATPATHRHRRGSPPRRSARSGTSANGPAGPRTRSICSRSTRRSRWSRWPPCAISTSGPIASTSTAGHARSVTRSARRARGSS